MYRVVFKSNNKILEAMPSVYPKPLAIFLAKQKQNMTTYGKWSIEPE
jgi:hypothetical protein